MCSMGAEATRCSNSRVDDQNLGPAVLQNPEKLVGGQAGVQHHQHGADQHRPEMGFESGGAVRREHGHAISGAYADGRRPAARR